jgi:hypothetical protein
MIKYIKIKLLGNRNFHSTSLLNYPDKVWEDSMSKLAELKVPNTAPSEVENLKKNHISDEKFMEAMDKANGINEEDLFKNSSSFAESFPLYGKTDMLDRTEEVLDVKTSIVKGLKIFRDLINEKNYTIEDLQKISLNDLLNEISKVNKDFDSEEFKKHLTDFIVSKIESVLNMNIGEISNMVEYANTIIVPHAHLNIAYTNLSLSLISYGLMMRTFNNLIVKQKIDNLTSQEAKIMRLTKKAGFVFFGVVAAPMTLFAIKTLKGPIFNPDINLKGITDAVIERLEFNEVDSKLVESNNIIKSGLIIAFLKSSLKNIIKL